MKNFIFFRHTVMIFLSIFCVAFLAMAADGDLDASFAGDGRQTVDFFGVKNLGSAIALQADEKIVGVGQATDGIGNTYWAVTRLNANGSLDNTFGVNGEVVTDVGDPANQAAHDVAIQNDGKIVVVGRDITASSFFIVRYHADGSLDGTFGTGGIVNSVLVLGGVHGASAVAIQSDGKIVVAGTIDLDFAVARYNTDGTLDTAGFGSPNGFVTTNISAGDIATDMIIQSDGKIVVTGFSSVGLSDFTTVRYNSDGSLDGTFGAGGIVVTDISVAGTDVATTIGLQSDGSIIVGGYAIAGGVSDFVLVRYTPLGALDLSFGTLGIAFANVGTNVIHSRIAVRNDDKIVLVGHDLGMFPQPFIVLRYTKDGMLDTTFGEDGVVTTLFSGNSGAQDVVIQSDRKIVVIGTSNILGASTIAFARYFGSCGIDVIGSDTQVEAFSFFQPVSSQGRIAKLAALESGFGLCGDIVFDSIFPVSGSICLNGFTLLLNKDLITHNTAAISTMGNIIGNDHQLDLAKSVTCIPTLDCPLTATTDVADGNDGTWSNLGVFLNCDICLQDTYITFTGHSMINGRGQMLTLDENSGIFVDEGGTLLLKNIVISGVKKSNIACLDHLSTISLKDVTWLLDGDYTFSMGHFDVIARFEVTGQGRSFTYQSSVVSSIGPRGTLFLDRDITFIYDPSVFNKNLINLTNEASRIFLNGATVESKATGIQFLRGKFIVDKKSLLKGSEADGAEGIMFGDGVDASNNLQVVVEPAATLELVNGFLIYADA